MMAGITSINNYYRLAGVAGRRWEKEEEEEERENERRGRVSKKEEVL